METYPSFQFFEKIYAEMCSKEDGKGDTLLFIHGYNTDLKDALSNINRLHKLYVEPEDSPINTIIIFTWSSLGKLLKYGNDARDAQTCGQVFARGFLKYIDYLAYLKEKNKKLCNQKIHLMVHSHGNKVLESTMRELTNEAEELLSNHFENIILLAADIDRDALHSPKPLFDLVDIGEVIHLFYHKRDRVLTISKLTKNNLISRLGGKGPKRRLEWLESDYRLHDVSKVEDDLPIASVKHKLMNHWYYYTSSKVIKMIITIFKS